MWQNWLDVFKRRTVCGDEWEIWAALTAVQIRDILEQIERIWSND